MVTIPYAKQEFNFGDGKGKCIRLDEVGPKEFVTAIKHADYVFTDSFHGAVFSIIFHKQFFVFERNRTEGHVSMNSRLYDLLELFGLSDRMLSINEYNSVESLKPIDYKNVQKLLSKYREKSIDFLINALDNM